MEEAFGRGSEIDERLLANERDQVVRDAMSSLPKRWQRLLEMLMADPPISYAEISDQLRLPVGSIGPTRDDAWRGYACCCRLPKPRPQAGKAESDRAPRPG